MPRGSLTVLHVSDFQCGRPFVPRAAEALERLAAEVGPDVIVCSGDLTQRAKSKEFEQARSLLDRLGDVPKVVTPGNHDVPLYRLWERLLSPHRNWRTMAGPDLDTVASLEGATIVALDSSAPHRAIVNGRLDRHQVDFARNAFEASPPDVPRILVTHHHFVPVPDGDGGAPLPNAAALAAAFEEMGVDLILGGHVHRLHIRTSADVPGHRSDRGVPIVASGTTTSRRGRGPERGRNSLTVVRFDADDIEVTPYHLGAEGRDFEADRAVVFNRSDDARTDAEPVP